MTLAAGTTFHPVKPHYGRGAAIVSGVPAGYAYFPRGVYGLSGEVENPVDLPDPTAYWPMDASAGGTTPDVVNAADLTLNGNLTTGTPKNGAGALAALYAAASNTACPEALRTATQICVSMWFTANATGTERMLAYQGADSPIAQLLIDWVAGSTQVSAMCKVAAGGNASIGQACAADGAYHHVLVVQTATWLGLWVDGTGSTTNTSQPYTIAAAGNVQIDSLLTNGYVDEMAIWIDDGWSEATAAANAVTLYYSGTGAFWNFGQWTTTATVPESWSPALPTTDGAVLPQVWFKADSIDGLADGDPVSTWADSTGNNHTATQSNGTYRPTFQTAEMNGLPVVRFATSKMDIATTVSLNAGWTIFTVVNNATGLNVISNITTDQGPYGLLCQAGTLYLATYNTGVYSTASGDPSLWHGVVIEEQFSNSKIFRNGAEVEKTPFATAGVRVFDTLGAYGGNTGGSSGDLAELVVYNSVLSDLDIAEVEAYLAAKWDITLAA